MTTEFKTAQQLLEEKKAASPEETPTSIAASPAIAADLETWEPPEPWSGRWHKLVLDIVDPERKADQATLALFFTKAKQLQLDPLGRQIHLLWLQGRPQIYVGIHALRTLAERTGERGTEITTHVEREGTKGSVLSITVAVERIRKLGLDKFAQATYSATARMEEYRPADVKPFSSWATKPEIMLEKCAAALAYRKAFPEVLGDVYTREELDSAEARP